MRTIAFLTLTTVFFLGAGLMLSVPMAAIARIMLIGVYVLVFLLGRWWLVGLSRLDGQLDARLRRATREVSSAHDRWFQEYERGDMEAARAARLKTARACDAAVAELDGLKAENPDWRETIRLLREYFVALETSAVADEEGIGTDGRRRSEAIRELSERANLAWRDAVSRARM